MPRLTFGQGSSKRDQCTGNSDPFYPLWSPPELFLLSSRILNLCKYHKTGKKHSQCPQCTSSTTASIHKTLPFLPLLFLTKKLFVQNFTLILVLSLSFCHVLCCLGPPAAVECSSQGFSPVESEELDFHGLGLILKMPSQRNQRG